jgi:hypothetical protein
MWWTVDACGSFQLLINELKFAHREYLLVFNGEEEWLKKIPETNNRYTTEANSQHPSSSPKRIWTWSVNAIPKTIPNSNQSHDAATKTSKTQNPPKKTKRQKLSPNAKKSDLIRKTHPRWHLSARQDIYKSEQSRTE